MAIFGLGSQVDQIQELLLISFYFLKRMYTIRGSMFGKVIAPMKGAIVWYVEAGRDNQKEKKKMGKQFNYYISPEEDIAFTQELIEMGYCIMKFVVVDKKDDAYMAK